MCSHLPFSLVIYSPFSSQSAASHSSSRRVENYGKMGKVFVTSDSEFLQYKYPTLPSFLAKHWEITQLVKCLHTIMRTQVGFQKLCNKARHGVDLSTQCWEGRGRRITRSYWEA